MTVEQGARSFVIALRERYVRFETGESKREQEALERLEALREQHRRSRNIVSPPFSAADLVRRNRPPAGR